MISRKSAKTIADTYHKHFTNGDRRPGFHYKRDSLYDFLYINNFEVWLLNAFNSIPTYNDRGLKEFIMRIHTGESLVSATLNWNWQQRQNLGQCILKNLAECLIYQRYTDPDFERYGDTDKNAVDFMQKVLELDGYIYHDGVLWIPEETVIKEAEEQGVLEGLMKAVDLEDITTIKHHLDLSATHYEESRWDDSISNSRKILEGVLSQVAARQSIAKEGKSLPPKTLERAVEVRDYLEQCGLIEKKEKETISQVYGLLSDTGGHPYIAERDQARLMRHLSLTFTQFILLRLEGFLRSKGSITQT
jgi:hypothetical protein